MAGTTTHRLPGTEPDKAGAELGTPELIATLRSLRRSALALESLAKDGLPTRAEVTDAAWASRAECVMLNKGPHIVAAMRFLDDVFGRMHEHQDKRTPMLRRLSVSTAFGEVDRTQ